MTLVILIFYFKNEFALERGRMILILLFVLIYMQLIGHLNYESGRYNAFMYYSNF